METSTFGQLEERYGFGILDHLDQSLEVPVLKGMQVQGDLAVIPVKSVPNRVAVKVPNEGVSVIQATGSGHEHRLFPSVPGTASLALSPAGGTDIGVLECSETAYLAHKEHAYTGIAPGTYTLRRQREQAAVERVVAD